MRVGCKNEAGETDKLCALYTRGLPRFEAAAVGTSLVYVGVIAPRPIDKLVQLGTNFFSYNWATLRFAIKGLYVLILGAAEWWNLRLE